MKDIISRRDFLRTTGIATLWIAGGCQKKETEAPAKAIARIGAPKTKSVVAVVTDGASVDENWQINSARVERMVHEAVMLLTHQSSPEAAWVTLFPRIRPTDVAGIKVNTLNPICPSHREVALAVAAGLQKAGFKENNIIIWDRAEGSIIEGLTKAGFEINRNASGVRCLGTNSPNIGYDQRSLVSIPSIEKFMPVSKLVSQVCQYIVNIPVLKNHGITGITGCLKSFYGAIPLGDRPLLSDINAVHQNNGNPQIAELCANPVIKEKTRLHIGDALMGICTGGPHGRPQWRNQQILAATDPVAMDHQCLQIINAKRVEKGERPIDRKAEHIRTAEDLGLGTCTPCLIEKTVISNQ